MDLLYITNDNYIPHVAAAICSVFENNKDIPFSIHVLSTDVTAENIKKLRVFVEQYNHTLEVITISPKNIPVNLTVCGKWGIFPSLKLFAVDYFPNVERILYMDADMICMGSIREIKDCDLSHYYFAAVTDSEQSKYHVQRLRLKPDSFYGCAGLMYMNLKKWREDGILNKCLSFMNAPENIDVIKFGEQDAVNAVCNGKILELPIAYNMFTNYWHHCERAVPERYKVSIKQNKRNPVIVHYIDACKPWFRDCRFPLKSQYHKYASMTPWGDQDWGYSPMYEGHWQYFKNSIKYFLHRLGIKKNDYAYDDVFSS